MDAATGTITQALRFPDLDLSYRVSVSPAGGDSFRIVVDLDKPLPPQWIGRVGFNLGLFRARCSAARG